MNEIISQPNSEITTDENADKALAVAEMSPADISVCALLLGIDDFSPTRQMIQTFVQFVKSDGTKSPAQVLRDDVSGNYGQWYNWLSRYPKFDQWWESNLERVGKGTCLQQVHRAIARRACKDSPQDAKMYLERFDKKYKPSSQVTLDAGFTPGSVSGSQDRQRKALEE